MRCVVCEIKGFDFDKKQGISYRGKFICNNCQDAITTIRTTELLQHFKKYLGKELPLKEYQE